MTSVTRQPPAPAMIGDRSLDELRAGRSRVQFVAQALIAQIRAHPGAVINNLFSIRLMLASLMIAIVPGVVGALIHPVVSGILFCGTFLVVWVASAANPLVVLYCPSCQKRVKMGADACHHCGRVVVPA
jgi:hypothetical protein